MFFCQHQPGATRGQVVFSCQRQAVYSFLRQLLSSKEPLTAIQPLGSTLAYVISLRQAAYVTSTRHCGSAFFHATTSGLPKISTTLFLCFSATSLLFLFFINHIIIYYNLFFIFLRANLLCIFTRFQCNSPAISVTHFHSPSVLRYPCD